MKPETVAEKTRPGGRTSSRTATPPPVPLTLDGASVLHQMFRVRWSAWKALATAERNRMIEEAVPTLSAMEDHAEGGSAFYSQLGHKGDLMVVHFRHSFEAVNEAELQLAQLNLVDYLEPMTSYLSVVELGLYEASVQLYDSLLKKGVEPGSREWVAAEEERLSEQRQAMAPRLWPKVPPHRYLCFYPMDKKRGEVNNWYNTLITERRRMMRDHGMIGRRYAGKVKQIISGSIGFDDWEWGVDLFADDPLVFKKLIYEMRFDEASALYALFGAFYLGIRFPAEEIGKLLSGTRPQHHAPRES